MQKFLTLLILFFCLNTKAQLCFNTAVNYTSGGNNPSALLNADFNVDGKLDLAIANQGSNDVSILLGTGTGTFGLASNFSVGASPYSVASADFNGDGKLDLVVANSGANNVSILLGTGTGSFGVATNFAVGSIPYSVSVADFNGDGNMDIATANAASNNVSVLLGTGTGSFASATNYTAGTGPQFIINADFNRDGVVDLAVANNGSNNVSILIGTGSGTFGVATNFTVGTAPYSITSNDFNRDGIKDLAVVNYSSNDVSVLLGTGTGSFGVATNFATGFHPVSVASADFDADGKVDLAVVNNGTNNVSVLLGDGTGSMATAIDFTAGTGSISITTSDFNQDGKIDLSVLNATSANVSVLTNCTIFCTGSFEGNTSFAAGFTATSITNGDFNRDGIIDLAVANYSSGSVSVLLGTGTGSFGAPTDFALNIGLWAITNDDFNNDGNLDIAVVNKISNNVSILLGLGNGSFGVPTDFVVGSSPQFVTTGDFNRDGVADLAITNYGSNNISILLGNGAGSFGAAVNYATGFGPQSLVRADFNKDGILDLVVTHLGSNHISVLLGIGTGAFGLPNNYPADYAVSIIKEDFNRDGIFDLALVNNNTDIIVLLGTGNGSFGAPVSYYASCSGIIPLASLDYNRDGIIDLALVDDNSPYIYVMIGTGTGSFGSPIYFSTNFSSKSIAVGDFNRDGFADIATANWNSNNVSILLLNTPNPPTGSATQTLCSANSTTVADLIASGTGIQWYATSSGGVPLANSMPLVSYTHYYASQTINSCGGESVKRLDVTAIINTTPSAPSANASQSFCSANSSTVANLLATGTAIKWYSASSGGSPIQTNTILTDNTHYYASQTIGGCESINRFDVTVTVNTTPNAPSGSPSQLFCADDAPVLINLIATGTSIQWYSMPSGGGPLSSNIAITDNTNYYATQTLNNCESINRFEVLTTVTVNPIAPTASASQLFCSGASPSVNELTATGTSIQWYAASSGGSPLATSTALADNTHYHASQTVNGCESTSRVDVTATINTSPAVPTGTATQIFCSGISPTVDSLIASGTAIKWYAASTGGAPLATSTVLADNTHYYATQTVNACESATRLDVTATVNTTPNAPSGTTSQLFCTVDAPVLTDLIVAGTSIQWYSAPSGGSQLLSGIALTDNTHYYATQTLNNCESISRLDVTATINTTPAVPTGTATQLFCSASMPSIADLTVTGTGIQWYTDSIAGTVLPTNTTLIDSIHYYASQLVNSCESATRLDILAIVNTTPIVVPTATDMVLCAGDSVVLSGGGATTYVWSGSVSDGISFAPLATDTYTVIGTASNSCSDTATITISVNSLPVVTASATDLSFCKGDSTVLNAMGALSYVWSDGVTNGTAFAPLTTTTYTVTGTDANACNAQASVTVNVIQLPDVTTSVSGGTITANQSGAAYQWINCDNENAPLFGQFNRTFTATANGSYAVVVVKNGCTDTSACIDFTNVGITEKNDKASHFTIYPNPFTSQTTIDFVEEQVQTSVKIIDILGKEIKVIDFTGKQLIIEREDMQAGVYFVHIMNKNKHLVSRKIVIQ